MRGMFRRSLITALAMSGLGVPPAPAPCATCGGEGVVRSQRCCGKSYNNCCGEPEMDEAPCPTCSTPTSNTGENHA